ncbi:yvrD [Symbiodinium sp. KB8]|nr:yvrD [Symbiodinium sp. KB8]
MAASTSASSPSTAGLQLGLAGKRVLVTGSTSGIGRGIAQLFLQCGSTVYVNGRSQARCEAVCAELQAGDGCTGTALPAAGDMTKASGCKEVFAAVDAGGELDVLICNFGQYQSKAFEDFSDEEWEEVWTANVMSVVRCTRHYLPTMRSRNTGRVVVIASEAGIKPLPNMVPYSTSKSAVIGLVRGLAETTKGTGVTVNSVLAGPTATAGVQQYFQELADGEGKPVEEVMRSYFKEHEPTSLHQRLLTVEEVANVVVFLASSLGGAVNGASQRAEGGIIRHI